MGKIQTRVIRDLLVISFSILLAILLARSGTIEEVIKMFEGSFALTAFLAGLMFTSIFTTAIGTAVFLVLGIDGYNPFLIAVIGGVGAVFGDLLIFRFVKNDLVLDLEGLLQRRTRRHLEKWSKNKLVSYALAAIGGGIIASPLPDELGIALLAISGVRSSYFSTISYTFNMLGILLIVLIGELF